MDMWRRQSMGQEAEDAQAPAMRDARVRLLHAASHVAGGVAPLAQRLGISEAMLGKYVSGTFPLPDPLLLQALDFIEEHRNLAPPSSSGERSVPPNEPREA
jgi:hypothetical protein